MYPNKFFNPKTCKRSGCENEFVPSAPSQLYCSAKCRGQNSYYLRNYGIDDDGLATMRREQNSKCFLCGSAGFIMQKCGKQSLVVDHDHQTGQVRKLLCHNCNRALGLFKDNPEVLRRAAQYVEDHR